MATEQKPDVASLLKTPEAQAAISAAVAEAMKTQAPLALSPDTSKLFSDMALQIAEMSHQGSGRVRPVAPEVMQARAEAKKKLDALLAEVGIHLKRAKENNDDVLMQKWMPRYQVIAKIFFNETFVEPFTKAARPGDPPIPSIITWSGPPNDALIPVNDIAKKLKQLFKESVGTGAKLDPVSGPNGGQVSPDRRPYWMTVQGRVVQGTPPVKAVVLDVAKDDPDYKPHNDPSAPFVHVLGTVHPATPQKPSDAATLARA